MNGDRQPRTAGAMGESRSSNPDCECVELARLEDTTVAIRHSRYPDGLWLYFEHAGRAFIEGAKTGEFDHLVDNQPGRDVKPQPWNLARPAKRSQVTRPACAVPLLF